jgi:non-heme chloroperoxidase
VRVTRRSTWCSSTSLLAAVLALASSSLSAQQPNVDHWRDTARHRVGYINVTPTVRLHYLDFGGTGAPIVFLAGLGNTAHAFDDFAPRFTDRFHVIAVTRRGFGESTHPTTGYDTPRLVEDIRTLIDRLHFQRVILIGHSIAGEEMSRFAATYPDRVAKLVYLDAAYDRVAADSMLTALLPTPLDIPAPPQPAAADTATAGAYVDFVHRTRGVNIPEADIRTRFKYDGWKEELSFAYQAIATEHPPYRQIRAPALAIYAVIDSVSQLEPWQRLDQEHAAAIQNVVRLTESMERTLRAQFRNDVAHSGVLEIRGAHHWIFVSNGDEVASAIRRFLTLP